MTEPIRPANYASLSREEQDAHWAERQAWEKAEGRQNGAAGPTKADTLTSVCAVDIKPKRIIWFWPNHYALGKIGVLGGHPDEGKTLILLDMIARATTGANWPCNEGKAPLGKVILLTAEDDLDDTVIPRLIAAGADLKRVHIIQMVKKPDGKGRIFSLLTDLEILEQKITEIDNVVMIGIDPLSAYLGVGKMDSFRTTDVRGLLSPLKEVAQNHKLALVCIMHFNKNVSVTNAMLRFSDSLAYVAAARHAFVVTRDEEDETRRLFLRAKNNLVPEGKNGLSYQISPLVVGADDEGSFDAPRITWSDQHVTLTANQALEKAAGNFKKKEPTETYECVNFLKVELADGPLSVKEIERRAVNAGLLGEGKLMSKSTPFQEARKELDIIAKKGGLQDGWTLELPKKPWEPA